MHILGIETSCDETAAAVVDEAGRVLSNVVHSQVVQHRPYGGVVPEIASRSHVETLPSILAEAIRLAGCGWDGLDAIAVTRGPGLVSSLLIGVTAARALALRLGKPLIGINHLHAHIYSIFLSPDAPHLAEACPMLMLMVSGGHTCLVEIRDPESWRLLGQTLDDAAGEALDKGANLLRLGYPGGPAIEKAAAGGNAAFVRFPRGLRNRSVDDGLGLDRRFCFSFSGLKTALLYFIKAHPSVLADGTLRDVAASYQEAVFDSLLGPVESALQEGAFVSLGCGGGVARNRRLRDKLDALAARHRVRLILAAPEYCTDNAAMVAAAAAQRGPGFFAEHPGNGNVEVQPNLPLVPEPKNTKAL